MMHNYHTLLCLYHTTKEDLENQLALENQKKNRSLKGSQKIINSLTKEVNQLKQECDKLDADARVRNQRFSVLSAQLTQQLSSKKQKNQNF